jgi:hypothetical protein
LLKQVRPIENVDKFLVMGRFFPDDAELASVGLVNMHAEVPNTEANREKILRMCQIFQSLNGGKYENLAICRILP